MFVEASARHHQLREILAVSTIVLLFVSGIAALEPVITGVADMVRVYEKPLDHLFSNTFLNDWCSMRHETQYTRLFRS